MIAWLVLAVVQGLGGVLAQQGTDLLTQQTLDRRSLKRFNKSHEEHSMCWERHGVDGFLSVIDTHNHFRPFFGPAVPFLTYLEWMIKHGILFSTMFGIGQKIEKAKDSDPDCCYYLHCPTLDYRVVPSMDNDYANADDFTKTYMGNKTLEEAVHLTLSITFPNLQSPAQINKNLNLIESTYEGAFKWAGEINVFKHALASNGFFEDSRVTEKRITAGEYDKLFGTLTVRKWPTTLHCDLGCDNYDAVPVQEDHRNKLKELGCHVPAEEVKAVRSDPQWWTDILGVYYHSFFDKENNPRDNFKKIMHLKVWDTLLSKYPDLKVVWAHLGLSKELKTLHPYIHVHILRELFKRHKNLVADISWDVLAKQLLMNHKSIDLPKSLVEHTDFNTDTNFMVNTSDILEMREELHAKWEVHEDLVSQRGSVSGPSYSMAIYLELFHEFPDRFLTGTDFVASFGKKSNFPGTKNKNGCVKDVPNHARQLTDTSSINMFLDDESFRKIVLGENFFRLTGLSDIYAAPPVCGDTLLPVWGLIVLVVVLLVVVLVVVLLVIFFCRKRDAEGGAFVRVGDNPSATTNV